MHNFVLVTIGYGGHQLLKHNRCRLLGKMMLVHDEVEELSTFAHFSHDIEVLLILIELQNLKHIRVVYFSQEVHFIDQLVLLTFGLLFLVNDFNGHFLPGHVMNTLANFSERTFTDRRVEETVVLRDLG